jgi:hypothetical protein
MLVPQMKGIPTTSTDPIDWVTTVETTFKEKDKVPKYQHKQLDNLYRLALSYTLDFELYSEFFEEEENELRNVEVYKPIHKKLVQLFTDELPSSIPLTAEDTKALLCNTTDTLLSPKLGNRKPSLSEENRKALYWITLHYNYATILGERESIFIDS